MKDSNQGISLVELVTAVSILAVSTLMIISCFYGISSIKTKSMIYENMELVSRNIFEELRATGDWSVDELLLVGTVESGTVSLSSEYFEGSQNVYEYKELYVQVKLKKTGLCTLVFTSEYYENEKEFYFWVNPDLINSVDLEEVNEEAE